MSSVSASCPGFPNARKPEEYITEFVACEFMALLDTHFVSALEGWKRTKHLRAQNVKKPPGRSYARTAFVSPAHWPRGSFIVLLLEEQRGRWHIVEACIDAPHICVSDDSHDFLVCLSLHWERGMRLRVRFDNPSHPTASELRVAHILGQERCH